MVAPSPFVRRLVAVSVLLVSIATVQAQSQLPPASLPLDSLSSFQHPAANWTLAGGIGGDPRRDSTLTPLPGNGVLMNLPSGAARDPLTTTWEHGDLELDLDFLLPPGSHAGIFLQGRYWLGLADGGRAPGLWQHLHLEFQAPRFDASGNKTRGARFAKIVFNDFVTGEDVEPAGPALQVSPSAERPFGPLVLAGDGGSVALRAIKYKRYDPALRVGVEDLAYKLYAGEFWDLDTYASTPPKSEGTPPGFAADAVERSGKFALVFTGNLVIPRQGRYAFAAESQGPLRLVVDGQPVVAPLDQGGGVGPVMLTAGKHAFRLDFVHTSWRPPTFRLSVEGPELASQTLAGRPRPTRMMRLLPIEPPADRVRLQRSFVPYEPKKRLYAINVGTPRGVHYSYDFETGAILRVWRGHFLDMFEMWDGRGENQIAKPTGPVISLNAKPSVALLERASYDWPDAPEPLWSSQGYTLESDGQPVFLAKLASLDVRDRIAPSADGLGLTRTLTVSGRNTEWDTWILLAESDSIDPQPNGTGFVIGDREYYIDVPADSAAKPIVRTRNGRQQLVVPVSGLNVNKTVTYTLSW